MECKPSSLRRMSSYLQKLNHLGLSWNDGSLMLPMEKNDDVGVAFAVSANFRIPFMNESCNASQDI